MQNFTCIGRLTKNPEISTVTVKDGSVKVARYTVAVNRDRNKDEADFFNCEVWRGGAEFAEKYLRQGKRVSVTGKIRQDHYEKDGQNRVVWKIIVDAQEPIDWPEKDATAQVQPTGTASQPMPYAAAPQPVYPPMAANQGQAAYAQPQETYAPAPNPAPAQGNVYQNPAPVSNINPNQGQPQTYMNTQSAYVPVSAPVNPPAGYIQIPDFSDEQLPF